KPTEPAPNPTDPAPKPEVTDTARQSVSPTTAPAQKIRTVDKVGKNAPKTGDQMNLSLWLIVLSAAAEALVIMLICRRKAEK
ncbi:MAG: hypothetical protein ACOYBF_05450, partial [Bilifractor porci]